MKTQHTVISKAKAQASGQLMFFTGIACGKGHLTQRYVSNGYCTQCAREAIDRFREKHPKEYFRDEMRKKRMDRRYRLYEIARDYAAKQSLKSSITKDDIIIPDTCPCCGSPLKQDLQMLQKPSIVRLSREYGYTRENIAIVCGDCRNRMGNTWTKDSTIEDLEEMVQWMKSRLKQ